VEIGTKIKACRKIWKGISGIRAENAEFIAVDDEEDVTRERIYVEAFERW
jgi:hypothetical protein